MSVFSKPFHPRTLILSVSLFLVLFSNGSFFSNVIDTYGLTWTTAPMIFSLGIVLMAVLVILLTLFSSRYILKPFLIMVLLSTSLSAYFMNSYDIVIDAQMIQNILETDIHESADLFSLNLVLYFLFLGALPSIAVYRVKIERISLKQSILEGAQSIAVAVGIAVLVMFTFSKFYTSFFREHKSLRYYSNPKFFMYSIGQYIGQSFTHHRSGLQCIGTDACIQSDDGMRELVILVVGEAVRADHFGLNGYSRQTTPLLAQEDIINFPNFMSCGTETAVSVPCMFSSFGREGYEKDKARHTENVLDVFVHAGVNVLWRDNNSDSKGVADRIEYQSYTTSATNTMCDDVECRDEGMLVGLQEYINAHPKGDIIIVLHQMGNHGPDYYKRYPKAFEKYTPTCKTNQLEQCTQEEITNAYDNSILYTDYFLSKVIGLLKKNDTSFETAMFYLSDHGESLGEKGLYLHGFPYMIAPDAQKHVPAFIWFGKQFGINKEAVKREATQPHSQDNLFHTLLGFVEVNTSIYRPELDILHGAR